MQKITLYREDNGQYSTSEAKQDDISGVYIQVEEIEQLKQENAELKYQIKMRDKHSCSTCKGFGTVMIAIDDGADCPECVQRDNDIKADAVLSIMDEEYSCETPTGDIAFSSTSILEHAEQLRNKK